MTNPYWKEGGGFIPFRFPIETNDDAILDDPLWTVSFNVGWRKYVLGACAALARPETWKTDDPFIAEGAALEGQELLERIASGVECIPGIPSPAFWTCGWDFTYSDQGWQKLYTEDGKWGNYSYEHGWQATSWYNSDVHLYIKRLAVMLVLPEPAWVRGVGFKYDTDVDFAPGGQQYRNNSFMLVNNFAITEQFTSIHGSTAYNVQMDQISDVYGFLTDRVLVNGFCGASESEALLEDCTFTLRSAQLYGWAGTSPCA